MWRRAARYVQLKKSTAAKETDSLWFLRVRNELSSGELSLISWGLSWDGLDLRIIWGFIGQAFEETRSLREIRLKRN